jgi:Ca2+-binding EF-hand superfamily protein
VDDLPLSEDARRKLKYFVPRTHLPEGLPSWFVNRDADGDGQLTIAEFSPKATRTQLDQFTRYDANGDGLITSAEYLRGAKPANQERVP